MKRQKSNGFGLAEVCTTACFIVVAAIVSIDCWFLISATRLNDAACRDAARAASLAPPPTADRSHENSPSYMAALAAAQAYAPPSNSYISAPQITVTYNAATAGDPTSVPPTPSTPPSVTVVSTCTVKPLVPLTFAGSSFSNITCTQQYTFPNVTTKFGAQINNTGN